MCLDPGPTLDVPDPFRCRQAPSLIPLPSSAAPRARPSSPLPPITAGSGAEEPWEEEEADLVQVEALWTPAQVNKFEEHDAYHSGSTFTVSSRVESPGSAPAWVWSDDYLTAIPAGELGVSAILGSDAGVSEPEDDVSGPVPGPAAKGDTLKEFFAQRAGEWAEIEAKNPPSPPRSAPDNDPQKALEETAAHFHLTADEFLYALDNDLTYLDRWHALVCSTDDGEVLPPGALPAADTFLRPFPAVPKPEARAAPPLRPIEPITSIPPLHLWPEFRARSEEDQLPEHLETPEAG